MICFDRRDARPLSLRRAADVLQALAHPIRLQILDAIQREPATVSAIVERLELPQPIVSRHLAVLREAGAIRCTPRGRERVYAIGAPPTRALVHLLFSAPPARRRPRGDKPP